MGTEKLIELIDVHKKYYPPSGAVDVLKGVDFSLEKEKQRLLQARPAQVKLLCLI